MNTLKWSSTTDELPRGAVLDALLDSPISEYACYLQDYWNKLAEVCLKLGEKGNGIHIAVEVWPDSGRIISILEDRREFCRVCLTIASIEREYYNLPDGEDDSFDHEYDKLYFSVLDRLKESFSFDKFKEVIAEKGGCSILIRDSDDIKTDHMIM